MARRRKKDFAKPLSTARLRRLTRQLRQDFPTNLPVKIVRVPDLGFHGDTLKLATGYRIRLNKDDPAEVQAGTLIHEWAHALTWSRRDEQHHSLRWAERYAALTRWIQAEDEWAGTKGEKPPEEA